ncbi:MAG TPA: hypothetical protein VHM26_13200 [Chitinophagaceae bacterium]|jgi:hypothetical protein|nr:hypothetical protein [Chitinophagaceae bacterium]
MDNVAIPSIEAIIREYIESKEMSYVAGKKRIDAEKEYNRLLTKYNGESKTYSLDQANRIYKAFHDMHHYEELASSAQTRFLESERQLREVGEILFHASITAEMPITPADGSAAVMKEITVNFNHGNVVVSQSAISSYIN